MVAAPLSTAWPAGRSPYRAVPRAQWAAAGGVVVAAHLAVGWALLQSNVVREPPARHALLFVDWIAPAPSATVMPPEPPRPRPAVTPAPRPAPAQRQSKPPAVATVAATAAPAPQPVAAPVPAATPAPAPTPVVTEAAPALPAPAPPAPSPPAPPKTIAATAVQYAVPPAPDYPALSSRLRETGTVVVHVLIGEDGSAREVRLHTSSGHARLDAAALAAMRKARFRPHTENGQPVAVWAPAPIEFELEK